VAQFGIAIQIDVSLNRSHFQRLQIGKSRLTKCSHTMSFPDGHVSSPKDSSVLLVFFAFLDDVFELFSLASFDLSSICAFRSSSWPTAFRFLPLNAVALEEDENERPCDPDLELEAAFSFDDAPSLDSVYVSTVLGSANGGSPFSAIIQVCQRLAIPSPESSADKNPTCAPDVLRLAFREVLPRLQDDDLRLLVGEVVVVRAPGVVGGALGNRGAPRDGRAPAADVFEFGVCVVVVGVVIVWDAVHFVLQFLEEGGDVGLVG
jgi:hypothetical protein